MGISLHSYSTSVPASSNSSDPIQATMKTILVSVLMLSAALCFADDIDEDIDSMAADLLNTQETNQCSADTGGTCRVFSCNSSRKASCKNSKCVCPAGSCAIGGKCVATQAPTAHPTVQPTAAPTAQPTANPTASPSNQCSKNTGGTCRVFSCNSSRKASCKNSKCVCGAGKC